MASGNTAVGIAAGATAGALGFAAYQLLFSGERGVVVLSSALVRLEIDTGYDVNTSRTLCRCTIPARRLPVLRQSCLVQSVSPNDVLIFLHDAHLNSDQCNVCVK